MEKVIIEESGEQSIFLYYKNVLDKENYDLIYNFLKNMDDFKGGETSYGRKIPRLQKWYHTENLYFSKDWTTSKLYKRWVSHNYEKNLIQLQQKMQQKINNIHINYSSYKLPIFNSCLINKYRNGNDSIKRHSDNQSHFGENPTILGLSLGGERVISFERRYYNHLNPKNIKKDKNTKDNFDVKLEDNSIFIMSGSSQKYFTHEVKKEPRITSVRYNLTFREHH